MKIIKRNKEEVEFDRSKICQAVERASAEVPQEPMSSGVITRIGELVEAKCRELGATQTVEQIQDMVEMELMHAGYFDTARHYITYRYKRSLARKANTTDDSIMSLLGRTNEEINQENSNKNPTVNSTQRDYMAGEVSKDLTMRLLLPQDIVQAHDEGIIHFHDADYFVNSMYNCCLCNLEDILQNGTVISGTMIEKPHSFSTACTIATQVIAQVSSNQYGGQTITLSHLAPFVDVSRQVIRKQVFEEWKDVDIPNKEDHIEKVVQERLLKEITKGIQTINYQVQTLLTTNGQAPFLTVFMYLNEVPDGQIKEDLALIIEEVLKQRLQGVKNEKGVWITPAFPKLIYVLEEDNITEGSKYWDLTVLAAKTTAKRLCPDYISEKIMKQLKVDANGNGQCYPTMGCRSILTPYVDKEGKPKYYGRFNQGVVSVNLVDVACASLGNEEDFWRIFDERLELCHRALMIRHEHLLGTPSDVAPILWQYGAIARLKKGEVIDELLKANYSTLSLGYAGLAECVYRMKGCSHTDPKGKEFGLKVMQHMVDKTHEWRYHTYPYELAFSLYGTPIESTTYKFAKKLKERWGIIPNVTDKNYITNSYHVKVTEPIDAFTKLSLESEFQALSPGGERKHTYCATQNCVKTVNQQGIPCRACLVI